MPQPLQVSMTPGLVVASNYIIRFLALDPSDGSNISGVNVSAVAIQALDSGGSTPVSLPPQPVAFLPGAGA